MDERACPSVDEIRDFLNEQLAPARDQEVSLHIQECPSCSEVMTTVADSDETQNDSDLLPVLAEIRTLPKREGFEAEEACLHAVERARQISEQSSNSLAGSGLTDAVSRVDAPSKLGPYELEAVIGTGGMGSVYRATHSKLGRTVAVKVLHGRRLSQPSAIARFEREMKAVGQLEHPNIVRATDADEDDGVQYLVMEFLDGIDLSSLVRQHGPLPVPDACELVRQAAQGLQHAHENGFVHRDVKPANLMLSRGSSADGRISPVVKVLDLGLAMVDVLETGDALTSTGQVMGTIEYMAPEQFDETHRVDIRADIYGLGATLYKLLTGYAPLEDGQQKSRLQKLKALATEEPRSTADHREELPGDLVEILHRMLSRSPDDRYSTPGDVSDALLSHTSGADLSVLLDAANLAENAETASAARIEHASTRAAAPSSQRSPLSGTRQWMFAFAALAAIVIVLIVRPDTKQTTFNPASAPPGSPKRAAATDRPLLSSIRIENRTLIFEDRNDAADRFTIRTRGDFLTLLREEDVFAADVGEGNGTPRFSIRTSEFDGLRFSVGSRDEHVTIEDISGVGGDIAILAGPEGEDTVDVRGHIDLGTHSLTMTASRMFILNGSQITAIGEGSVELTSGSRITIPTPAAIHLVGNSLIRTNHGDITLTGDASTHSGSRVDGIGIGESTIETSTGSITLTGRTSSGFAEGDVRGVGLFRRTQIRSTGTDARTGRILIDGLAGTAGGQWNNGVHVEESTVVESRTADIILKGAGGTSERASNDGVLIYRESSIVSHDGDIRVTGKGGVGSDSCQGVAILVGGRVKTTGRGQIVIEGVGGQSSGESGGNNIGIDFDSGRTGGVIQSATGSVTLRGRGGTGVSRGIVFSGDLVMGDAPVSISGSGSDGAPDIHWLHGTVGDAKSKGDVTLLANSFKVDGGSVQTAGDVFIKTRTDEVVLEVSDKERNANFFKSSDLSACFTRAASLTMSDQHNHAWCGRTFEKQWRWFRLKKGKTATDPAQDPTLSFSLIQKGTPVRASTPLDGSERRQSCSFTADGLLVVLTSSREGSLGASDIWMAERASLDESFTAATNPGSPINTQQAEDSPSISRDGLTLVYASNRRDSVETGQPQIWMAQGTAGWIRL
jgi:serine/threonine protein kinase